MMVQTMPVHKRNNTDLKGILFSIVKLFCKKLRYTHLIAFLKYNSFKKYRNLLLCAYERRSHKTVLKSKPYLINSEPTNHCNYRCPFCPTGKKAGRPGGYAPLELYEKILHQIAPTTYLITLHGWGEPLMHKNLPEIIRLANKKRICTVVTTNGSILNAELSGKIISSKLDCLIFSIDGSSEESYQTYRRGGKYSEILNNLKELISMKKEMGSSTPFIEWQFLVFKHNEHELSYVKKIARETGVDNLVFLPAYTEDSDYDASDPKYRLPKTSPLSKPSDCKHLWTTLTFHWNGVVVPCCYDYPETAQFGNLHKDSFRDIWINNYFRQARDLVANDKKCQSGDIYCIQCLQSIP